MSLYDSLQETIQEVLNTSTDRSIVINFNHYENATIYNNGLENKGEGFNINIDNINTQEDGSSETGQTGQTVETGTNVNVEIRSNSSESSDSEAPENTSYIFPTRIDTLSTASTPSNWNLPPLPIPRHLPPLPSHLPYPPSSTRRLTVPPLPPPPPLYPLEFSSLLPTPPNSFPLVPNGILNNISFTFDNTDDSIGALTEGLINISNSLTEAIDESLDSIGNNIGASVKDVVNLTKIKLYKDVHLENKESACPICNEDYDELSICRINNKCNHFFHLQCIDNWYSHHLKCPTCNQFIF